jgi:hypothetical protein
MEKHNVVNDIIDYLDTRYTDLSKEMMGTNPMSIDYEILEAMQEVYGHLIAKLEDDYR